jgi:hypothetical protein
MLQALDRCATLNATNPLTAVKLLAAIDCARRPRCNVTKIPAPAAHG